MPHQSHAPCFAGVKESSLSQGERVMELRDDRSEWCGLWRGLDKGPGEEAPGRR